MNLWAALTAEYFQVFSVRLDLADRAKMGGLVLAVPDRGTPVELIPAVNTIETKKTATVWLDVAAELNVLLAQIIMPIENAGKLVAGDLVPLPQAVMEQVTICAEHTDFQFAGYLGQPQGMGAVRLVWPAAGQGHETVRGAAAAFENAKHSDEEIIMDETGEYRSNDGQAMITLHDPSNALLIDETASDVEPQLLS